MEILQLLFTWWQINPATISALWDGAAKVITASTPIVLGVLAYVQYRNGKRAQEDAAAARADTRDVKTALKTTGAATARATEEVKDELVKTGAATSASLSHITDLGEKTHTLVNSQYGIALALIVEKASRIYEISRLEIDRVELERAREKLAEHEAKQHTVDKGEK
jgi:hypothetical protein